MKNILVAILLEKTPNFIPEKNVPLTRTQGRESLGSSVSVLPMIKYCFLFATKHNSIHISVFYIFTKDCENKF